MLGHGRSTATVERYEPHCCEYSRFELLCENLIEARASWYSPTSCFCLSYSSSTLLAIVPHHLDLIPITVASINIRPYKLVLDFDHSL
jgi:hypothetical protein